MLAQAAMWLRTLAQSAGESQQFLLRSAILQKIEQGDARLASVTIPGAHPAMSDLMAGLLRESFAEASQKFLSDFDSPPK